MYNKVVHLTLSIGLIIWAFFLGISFWERYFWEKLERIQSAHSEVSITFTGKTINIEKENKNISITFNGQKLTSDKQTFSVSQ